MRDSDVSVNVFDNYYKSQILCLDYQNNKYLLGMVDGMFQKVAIYIS